MMIPDVGLLYPSERVIRSQLHN